MEIDFLQLSVIGGAFVIACAYYNYRSGYRDGVHTGMESTLKLLEDGGYIEVTTDLKTGEAEIKKATRNVDNKT
jgi:hypothetical protein